MTGLTAVLAEALDAARFGPFRFVGGNERYDYTQIRQLHSHALEGHVDLRPYELYSIEVRTEPSSLARLVEALKVPLSPYVAGKNERVGFVQAEMALDNLAAATVRAAAIASLEEAVAAIQQWASGAPWIVTRMFTLTGIMVQSALDIDTGVSLRQLPDKPHQLRRYAPSLLVDELQRPGLLGSGADVRGAIVLCSEEYRRPVFWCAGQPPAGDDEFAFPGGMNGLFSLVRALSLVCSACVETQFQWTNIAPLQRAFTASSGEGWGGSAWPGGQPVISRVPLTEPLLAQALCVSRMLQTAPEPVSELVNRVFSRWMNCLHERRTYDQLIEMRIALESLFAGTGRHEASLRVAYHGARYLGDTPETRRCIFDDLKTIYSTASTLIHGDTPKSRRDLRSLVQRAQSICRDAMLKMLSEAEIPDWTDLMLNGD